MKNNKAMVIGASGLLILIISYAAYNYFTINPVPKPSPTISPSDEVDVQLIELLKKAEFTGTVESTLEKRLGRKLDSQKIELGRKIFFDKFLGLHQDNSCAGCHAPTASYSDTQSIAIGVDNNNIVGPNRKGPRNQRRTPTVVNNAFYPKLMWNSRFSSISGDPFNNSQGFHFPAPEDRAVKFPPNDPEVTHLLIAQAHIPPTELTEMAGFSGYKVDPVFTSSMFQMKPDLDSSNKKIKRKVFSVIPRFNAMMESGGDEVDFSIFDDTLTHEGTIQLPKPDQNGNRNESIRGLVQERFNENQAYKDEFAKIFPEVAQGKPITYVMIAKAIAEFEFSLTFASAPIDEYAKGNLDAMSMDQKKGAALFFGRANCVSCHAVKGNSNEMFSDFDTHISGVPQVAPVFGVNKGNVPFFNASDSQTSKGNQDFGEEEFTTNSSDRYRYRTSPLRNVGVQPTFFHNGAFTKLEDAVQYHIDTVKQSKNYSPKKAGLDEDLWNNLGPSKNVIQRLDPKLVKPVVLSEQEFGDLISFLKYGLLDPRAKPENLKKTIPNKVPSGMTLPTFE